MILLYILAGLAVLILGLIVLGMCLMHRNLPWPSCVAMLSNFRLKLPPFLHRFASGGERDYSTLPQPLVTAAGEKVTAPEGFRLRRQEILRLFEEHVYGPMPEEGFDTRFQVVEQGLALEGKALRRQIKITVATHKGESSALMLMYTPVGAEPVPVVLGLNFRGNHAVLSDESILPSLATDTADGKWQEKRGTTTQRWNIENSIARGYAVATVYSDDFAPDSRERWNSRIIGIFDLPEFKVVGAWAFGLQRCLDFLQSDPAIDPSRMVLVGHSRLGKAAVWAGARDLRAAATISNDSGNSGASLSRGHRGETVHSINKGFPHWFCSGYARYGNNENALPVDQNLLLACIAPRKLYVANAQGDLWADPLGAFNALLSAQDAFVLHGAQPLSGQYPAVDTREFTSHLGLHLRTGWHDIQADDWINYLDFLDQAL